MGDTQSAQREGKEDAVAEEESSRVEDVQTEQIIEDKENKPLKNNGQISGMNGKTDGSIAEADVHCEDKVVAEVCDTSPVLVSPEETVPKTEEPLQEEETPLENIEINEKNSPDADEATPPEISETEEKLNEINAGFKRFFSNIGLKFTVKKGSVDKVEEASDVPIETNEGEPSSPDDVKDTTKETTSEKAEQNIDLNMIQETDNDSTTCPTLTDMTSEDIGENIEEKNKETTEAKEEVASDKAVEVPPTSTSVGEEMPGQDNAPEKESDATLPTPDQEEVMSPIKKFFTTGIFSGLRKKKKTKEPEEAVEEEKATNETTEKDLVGMDNQEALEKMDETGQDQQQVKDIRPDVETAAAGVEQKANELKEEIPPATQDTNLSTEAPEIKERGPEEKSPSVEPSKVIATEPDILSSQEKAKVQGSPLKRLLSGSSFKKLSKKQRDKKSGDAKLSDSGEHVCDQLSLPAESAENQKEETPARSPGEVAGEENSSWASFKKLVTPKKRAKTSSPSNEEAVITGSLEEPKPIEGEQISDASTEEKKRKDSPVSWDAFLCGSGKRRSRKTSDSEDETPRIEGDDNRSDGEHGRHGAESPLEISNEGDELVACSESPSEGDGGSTWKSLKKLVTPKRKAKDEDESKDNIPSDSEINKADSSFSIKKLLPGRKKRKSAEKQEQGSSDEADREIRSDDEDSETPAVVPLSEFEREDQVQIQAVIENHMPKAADLEPQQDLSSQITEPAITSDTLPAEPEKVQDTSEDQAPTVPPSNEEVDDQTEFISKYQHLSDIPEEGIIEESMTTPVSAAEEPARDDTIAEDLIELTSEAITAPEPVDKTDETDETEMVSAVSQLTESSKTSGNATPVPAEYVVKETETLLHQVVETISITPNVQPVCLDEQRTERIVGSVSPQTLGTPAQNVSRIFQLHKNSDATAICTGLIAEEFDEINKLGATAQTESVSEVSEVISTEPISEITTEEFETAEIAVDEVCEASVSQTQESIIELDSVDEPQPLVEGIPEINEAVAAELQPEDDKSGMAEVPLDETIPEINEAVAAELQPEDDKSGTAEVPLDETIPEINEAVAAELQPEDDKSGTAEVPLDETIPEINEAVAAELQPEDDKSGTAEVPLDKTIPEINEAVAAELQPEDDKSGTAEVPLDETIPEINEAVAAELQPEDDKSGTAEVPLDETNQAEIQPAEMDSHEADSTVAVTEENDKDIEVQIDQALLGQEDQIIKNGTDEVQVEDQDQIPETVEELQELTTVQAATPTPQEGIAQVLEKQVLSEGIPAEETVTGESEPAVHPTEANDELEKDGELQSVAMDAAKVEDAHVPEVSTNSVKDEMAETEHELQACMAVDVVTTNVEEGSAEEVEKQVLLENIPKPETDSATTSVSHETESEAVIQQDQASDQDVKVKEDQIIENITDDVPQDVKVEDEDRIPEVVDELQTSTAINIDSLSMEASGVLKEKVPRTFSQVLEEKVISVDIPAPCVENALDSVPDKTLEEVHHTEVNIDVEKKEQCIDIEAAAIEHVPVVQIVTSNEDSRIASIPNTAMETTKNIPEPLIATVANETEANEAAESAIILAPVMTDDMIETAEESTTVMMMHVPSVQFDDDHRIQVQVDEVDVRSADTTVETVLEVGLTEAKEVIDVCPEMHNEVENLFATLEVEQGTITEENEVISQDMTQHISQNIPETLPELVTAVPETKEMEMGSDVKADESELSEVGDQKVTDDIAGALWARQAEKLAMASVYSTIATEQEVSKDHMHTPCVPEILDVPIHVCEDLEETNVEFKKSEEGIIAEDSTCSSEELGVKELKEDIVEAKGPQTAPCQVAAPTNTGLELPQNTGIISTVGNVESPSSLSLEFKLNIQFGQVKSPASPPPILDTIKTLQPSVEPEVSIQAVEPVRQTEATEIVASQKQVELSEVAVQAEITEIVKQSDSRESAVLLSPPALFEVGIQAVQTPEPLEEIKPLESENLSQTELSESSVQATETKEPLRQMPVTESAVIVSQTVLSAVCIQQTKAVAPVQQTEEEHDQDVWLDAEENICTQESTGKSTPQSQAENCQAEKAILHHECEMAQPSHTGEAESQQETPKIGEKCELESEGEDFAIALEDPEITSVRITTEE